jgi:hypothetical protein
MHDPSRIRARASVIFGAHARGKHGGMQAHFQLDQRATQALGACAQLQSDQTDVTLQVARAPITDSPRVRGPTAYRWVTVCDGATAGVMRGGPTGSWNPSARRRQPVDAVRHDRQVRQRCVGRCSRSLAIRLFGAALAEHARAIGARLAKVYWVGRHGG